MRRFSLVPAYRVAAFCILLMATACSGGHKDITGDEAAFAGVPWPPSPAVKKVSDDIARLNGAEFAAHGGWSVPGGADMVLNGGTGLTWAMYTLSGFSTELQLSKFEVDFTVTPATPGDGTALWVGYGDYSKQRWYWTKAEPPMSSYTPAVAGNFISPSGLAALAVVIAGPGQAKITEVRFYRTGNTDLPAPQNLTGVGEVGVVHLDWDDSAGVTGYNVYRSVSADLNSPTKLNELPVTESQYDDSTVGVDITYFYAVTALKYSESAYSNIAEVYAPSENLDIPQNLRGTPLVRAIQLDWDPVEGATGYEVFRDESWRWNNPQEITTAPEPTTTFVDSTASPARIYYYRVRARHIGCSGLSNMVDIFVPQTELQAPENPRAVDITQTEFRTSWDWSITNPTSFTVYVSTYPNFSLKDEDESEAQTQMAWGRSLLWDERTEQTTYYYRMVARNASGYGIMTDDLPVTTAGYWHWSDPEEIGVGQAPLTVTIADNDFTVAYINDYAVDVARRNAGVWTVENVLQESDAPGEVERGGFSEYLDLTERDGVYVLGAYAVASDDLWMVLGAPGAWAKERVDGDGAAGLGHAVSGEYLHVTAGPTEYAVIFNDPGLGSLMLRTHPASGGTWSEASGVHGSVDPPMYHSLIYNDDDLLEILYLDRSAPALNLGLNVEGTWMWTDIAQSAPEALGAYNGIQKIGEEYWITAGNETTGDFYLLHGNDTTWTSMAVDTSGTYEAPVGAYPHLTTYGANLATVYYGYKPNRWYIGFYDGAAWSVEPLQVEGYTPGMGLDIEELNGELYLIFIDNNDGKVKCLKGIDPN